MFQLGKLLIQIKFAKSGSWCITGVDGEVRTHYFSIHKSTNFGLTAVSLIVGPVAIIGGITK